MGGGSGGGSSNTTTTQKADPWIGVQPYLTQGYQQLSNLYQPGAGPQYYQGQQVAPMNNLQNFGNQLTTDQGGTMSLMANNAYNNANAMGLRGYVAAEGGYGGAMNAMNAMGQTANNLGGTGESANLQAIQGLLGFANSGGGDAGQATSVNAMQKLMAAGDPANNPYLANAMNSAIRPVTQQFQEQVMPGIKAGANEAGQMGSSRQGVAEGLASRGYMDTVGDITTNMGNQAYAQGLQAMNSAGALGNQMVGMDLNASQSAGALGNQATGLKSQLQQAMGSLGSGLFSQGQTSMGQASALAPGVIGALASPGQIISGVGNQQQQQQQAQIDAEMQKWNYGQNLPYTMISDYLSMLNGAAGGQTTASQSGGNSGSRLTGALGGAASGAAMGSMFGPMGTGIGAAAGGLYGLFM